MDENRQLQAIRPSPISSQPRNDTPAAFWTPERIDLIRRTVAKGASDDDFAIFIERSKTTGLDPLAHQIYLITRMTKRGPESVIQTGIDGYRLIADRTGAYAGNDEPSFVEDEKGLLVKATITVWKFVGGVRCPFTASARWREYLPEGNQGFMWNKMPHTMLGKVCEALALRKAFPQELSGLYTNEEMAQAGPGVGETVNTTAREIMRDVDRSADAKYFGGGPPPSIAVRPMPSTRPTYARPQATVPMAPKQRSPEELIAAWGKMYAEAKALKISDLPGMDPNGETKVMAESCNQLFRVIKAFKANAQNQEDLPDDMPNPDDEPDELFVGLDEHDTKENG